MATVPLTTESRVFVAQMIRDLRKRQREGAALLHPGATNWRDALKGLQESMFKTGSPTRAGKYFARAVERLKTAQRTGTCFLNASKTRSRSGFFELLCYEPAQHPILKSGNDGVAVLGYLCQLQRNGCIQISGGARFAFLSWHALGRLAERSDVDIFSAGGTIAMCGMAGYILNDSHKHGGTGVSMSYRDFFVTGVMRNSAQHSDGRSFYFYDVLSVLPNDPKYAAQYEQGRVVTACVVCYVKSDDSDPRGYADHIPVLPHTRDDYVTRELNRRRSATACPVAKSL